VVGFRVMTSSWLGSKMTSRVGANAMVLLRGNAAELCGRVVATIMDEAIRRKMLAWIHLYRQT